VVLIGSALWGLTPVVPQVFVSSFHISETVKRFSELPSVVLSSCGWKPAACWTAVGDWPTSQCAGCPWVDTER